MDPLSLVSRVAVRPEEAGQASGAANAIREIGGVLGIAVLTAVFSARGSFATPSAFVGGFVPALTIGAITVAVGAAAALLIPPRQCCHRHLAQARRGGRVMTDPRDFYTGDQVFGSVPTEGGHGGLPDVVNGCAGSGSVIPGWLKVLAAPQR